MKEASLIKYSYSLLEANYAHFDEIFPSNNPKILTFGQLISKFLGGFLTLNNRVNLS